MATPTTGDLVVVGSAGGMAPFPTSVYADIEGVGSTWATGSGNWPEGRWAFQLIDDSTKAIYNSGLMNLSCPNSSVTATAYNRYGAAPNAGCVVFGAGTYYWRVKYQNRDGDWSAWVNSATFTVAANTRTKLYVSSGGNDSNDGSSGSPKLTLAGAAAAVSTDDVEIIISDDETVNLGSAVDISARNGIYVRRSGTGTNPPKIVQNQSSGVSYRLGDDHVIDGIEWEYDGATRRSCITFKTGAVNLGVLNQDTNEITSLMEIPSNNGFQGLVVYGGVQHEAVTRYCFFSGVCDVFNILGVDWRKGSTTEHNIRVGSGFEAEARFGSIDYSMVEYVPSIGTGKTSLRAYLTRFFGAYRCSFDGGAIALGDLDADGGNTEKFYDMRLDCCTAELVSVTSTTQNIDVIEDVERVYLASCGIYRDNPQLNAPIRLRDRTSGGSTAPVDVSVAGCTIYNIGSPGGYMIEAGQTTADGPIEVRGCLFGANDAQFPNTTSPQIRVGTGPPSGTSVTDTVFFDHSTVANAFVLVKPSTYYSDASTLNSQSFASGNIAEVLSVDQDTFEPSGGTNYQSALSDVTGIFESLNGEVIDRNDSTWAAGAWHPAGSGTGQAAGYSPDVVSAPSSLARRGAAALAVLGY